MKIFFLAGDELWFRRLPVALAAKDAGADVVVMAPFARFRKDAETAGLRTITWNISRRSLNPLREIPAFAQVVRAYRQERPDVIHHLALKAIIYGGAAARLCGGIAAVHTIAGLGRVFTVSNQRMLLLRRAVCAVLQGVFQEVSCRVTFENEDDLNFLAEQGIVRREAARFIPGVGLDTDRFSPKPENPGVPIVMLPSRMLWEKGIAQFVEAAAQLRQEAIQARFVLVGAPDLENRGYIPEHQLEAWVKAGNVEWWGSNRDMPDTLRQAHVVCLPTYYREGVPRVLMEASACGRAIVTTDMPGCRHAVRDGENGFLVAPKNVPALAAAIRTLLQDSALRKSMGAAGRERAMQEFAEGTIQRQFFAVYRDLLNGKWPSEQMSISQERQSVIDPIVGTRVCQQSSAQN